MLYEDAEWIFEPVAENGSELLVAFGQAISELKMSGDPMHPGGIHVLLDGSHVDQ